MGNRSEHRFLTDDIEVDLVGPRGGGGDLALVPAGVALLQIKKTSIKHIDFQHKKITRCTCTYLTTRTHSPVSLLCLAANLWSVV